MDSFKIGDIVVYGHCGICRIDAVESKCFDKKSEDYYVLSVMHNKNSKLFVPVNNEKLTANMRVPMTKEEIDSLLAGDNNYDVQWIDDKKSRPQYFKEIIRSGDKNKIMAMLRCIYRKKQELLSKHKTLPSGDERILNETEKLLNEEFAYALGIEADEVEDYIGQRIKI